MFELSDTQLIYRSLNYWANHIETGSVSFSANDAVSMGDSSKIKALNDDQKKLVIRLRELAVSELKKDRL